MIVLSLVIGCIVAVLLLPLISDLFSVAYVILRGQPSRPPCATEVPRLLFLVPAHNEEVLVESCLRSLGELRYPGTRFSVVVVADNCTDRTVELVRRAGVRCLERHDADRPGKPRAIAWALPQLPLPEYAAIVIVDADTIVDAEFAAQLALAAPLEDKATQGFHGVSNPTESPLTRMGTVLATATHRFAYQLKQRARLNVPLGGNGMAIGTRVLARVGWQAFSICEDWEMYALLTEQGVRVEGVPAARVYAQEARSLQQSSSQRQRWTAGKLTVFARLGPRVLMSRRIGARQKLDAVAELSALGPALHLGIAAVLTGFILAIGLPQMLTLALGASLVRPMIYGAAGLAAQQERWRTAVSFGLLPLYTVWRMGTTLRALRLIGDKPWVRTQRHPHQGS